MINILIVDDHAVVREGLKILLKQTEDIHVKNEASNGKDAIRLIRNTSFNLVILDISLPDMGGLEIMTQIKQLRPDLPVLFFSMHPEGDLAIRLLKAGASGYFTKEGNISLIVDAIYTVAKGGRFISPLLAEKLVTHLTSGKSDKLHENLSDREYQVLIWLAKGKTTREMAKQLNLSIKTIETYRKRIMEKTSLDSMAAMVAYAIRNNLVD